MLKKIILSVALIITIGFTVTAAPVEYDYNIEDGSVQDATRYPVAKSYALEKIVYNFGSENKLMSQPQDLFIAPSGDIYVADTGNNRILKFDKNLKLLAEFDNKNEKGFNAPSGVFVDEFGGIFVADTDNNRIVKMSKEGKFVEEFTKPKSELLDDDFVFNPRKIAVSKTGYLYAIKHQSLMSIDSNNEFRGYVGATQVEFDLMYRIRKLFANKKQRMLMEKPEPVSALSFDISDDGMVYVTTVDHKNGQMKKLNSVGKNIYPKKNFFGEKIYFPKEDIWKEPNFIDVAVNKDGMAFLLEEWSGRVYIYDTEGNNLVVFGGQGDGKSSFKQPVAIDIDSNNNVYVLDTQINSIKVFAPTEFMKDVFTAIKHYNSGDYEKDITYWTKVAQVNENYNLANKGIAKSLFKQGDYVKSMEYYKLARDKDGYSKAYEKQRHQNFRENFTLIVLAALLIVIAIIIILVLLSRYIAKTMKKYHKYV